MGKFTLGGAAWAGGVALAAIAVVHGLALWATAERGAAGPSAGEAAREAQGPSGRVRICRVSPARIEFCEECPTAGTALRSAHSAEDRLWFTLPVQICDDGPAAATSSRAVRLGVVLGASHTKARCENCPGADEAKDEVCPAIYAAGAEAADRSLADALSAVEELHRERGSALRGTLLDGEEIEREFNIILSNVPAGKLFRARCAAPAGCVEGCLNQACEQRGRTYFIEDSVAGPACPACPACPRTVASGYRATAVELPGEPTDELVASLRQSSRLLDQRSHALEAAELYEGADQTRAMAEELRLQARGLNANATRTSAPAGYSTNYPASVRVSQSPGYPQGWRISGACYATGGYTSEKACVAPSGVCSAKPASCKCGESCACPDSAKCVCGKSCKCSPQSAGISFEFELPASWAKALETECPASGEAASAKAERAVEPVKQQTEAQRIFNFFQGFTR